MPTINQETTNIFETAKTVSDFKTLVRLVDAAGLADALKSRGPYTVFAPSDEAFRNLPTGTVEGWLNDISKLKSILSYHVVNGKIMASEIHKMTMDGRIPSVATLQGSPITIKTNLTAQS